MKAKIIQFRRGRHRIHERHYLIDVGVKNREEAGKFVGKQVSWKSPGKLAKEIKGKISSTHGNNGLVRAIFETGLPGQAINNNDNVEVDIK